MKRILFISCLLSIAMFATAQPFQKNPTKFDFSNGIKVGKVLYFPGGTTLPTVDSTSPALFFHYINGDTILKQWNGKVWSEIKGDGSGPVDTAYFRNGSPSLGVRTLRQTGTNAYTFLSPVAGVGTMVTAKSDSTYSYDLAVDSLPFSSEFDLVDSLSIDHISQSKVTGLPDSLNKRFDLRNVASKSEVLTNTHVAFWGDSHTANIMPGTFGALTGMAAFNGGWPGENSTEIRTRMIADTAKYSWSHVFYVGINNPTSSATIKADIAAMIAAAGHTRYIVVSVINNSATGVGNADYNNILATNADLAALYGPRFADVRSYLVSLYDPSISQDVTDHANGIIPSSLRIDGIHLTERGYQLVAAYLATFLPYLQTAGPKIATISNTIDLFKNRPSMNLMDGGRYNIAGIPAAFFPNQEKFFGSQFYGSWPVFQKNLTGSDGQYNTSVGFNGMVNLTTGKANTGLGFYANYGLTTGQNNVGIGYQALQTTNTGSNNVATGAGALQNNTSGNSNVALGGYSMNGNLTGSDNVGIGQQVMQHNNGSYNIGIGGFSLTASPGTSFSMNTAIGYENGNSLATNANGNTLVGFRAGKFITTGGNNIVIGHEIDPYGPTVSNTLNIQNLLFGTGMTGTGATSAGNIGIGVKQPTEKLDVDGNLRLRGLVGVGDRQLVVDDSGKLKTSPLKVVMGGRYIPTVTSIAGTSNANVLVARYHRTDSTVKVNFVVQLTPSGTGVSVSVGIGLPFPSNFNYELDGNGIWKENQFSGGGAGYADATTKTMVFQYTSTGSAPTYLNGEFMYDIIYSSLLNGLVASYNLDEASGNAVDATGNFSSPNTANITYSATGKLGNAYTFNGSTSRIDLPAAIASNTFTYAAWIKTSSATDQTIFSGGAGSSPVLRVNSNGTLGLLKQFVTGIGNSSGTVASGSWVHVAVTYDVSGNYVFYINGAASGSGTNAQTFSFASTNWIGTLIGGEHFTGQIDQPTIWNRALTSSEISLLYNSSTGKVYPF